ncbi:MAG: vitamin K epoxide reductase family protein [Alkalinema sp. RU_4_3]|nr:vitamin K epoxide reductase family protein [Alkalinema sp. RU_4_3]
MVAIAALGVLDTAYITYEKLSAAQSSLCTAGCSTVLSSSYATVFGLPLGLFGLGAYGVVLLLAGVPLLKQEDPEVQEQRSQQTGFALFLVTAAMALFSGYLMYVLATDIQAVCYFCIASAIFSVSLLVLSLVSQREKLTELIFPGAITAMVTLVGAIALFTPSAQGMVPGATAIGDTSGNTFFYVNTPSSDAETQLAEHLKAIDAKMYGAYWCPHCCEQKRLFGATAMKQLKYVECGEGGQNAQVDTCRDLAPVIEKATGEKFGFPTWEINGQFYSGRQPLTELARLSDYKGPQNFQNTFGICPSP